ncbi:MAG: caspase family protein [Caldilineaceae bacterium]
MSSARIAFALNGKSGEELYAGTKDVSRVFEILVDEKMGMCDRGRSIQVHDCASRGQFLAKLEVACSRWNFTDQLVFYYSGHGALRNNVFGLCLGNEFQPFSGLLTELQVWGVERAILIIDSCHSGEAIFIKGEDDPLDALRTTPEQSFPKGISVLASSHPSELSFELPDHSGSLFTKLLCEAVTNHHATDDNLITIGDVVHYINSQLETNQVYTAYKGSQRPLFSVHGADREVWLAHNRTQRQTPTPGPFVVHKAITTEAELNALFRITLHDEHPCLGADIEDLDWELISLCAEHLGLAADLSSLAGRMAILDKLHLFSDIPVGGMRLLHKSAVLCFHKYPDQFFPQARSQFIVGDTATGESGKALITGPLSRQLDRLYSLVRENTSLKVASYKGGSRRTEFDQFDYDLVREALSNALTHRDYWGNGKGTVRVHLLPDRLEIHSPGGFPTGTDWDMLLNSEVRASCPVSAALSKFMHDLQSYEGMGNGFNVFRSHIKVHGPDSLTCLVAPGPEVVLCIKRRLPQASTVSAGSIPWRVPFLRDSSFIGRADVLEMLDRALNSKGVVAVQPTAVVGMGGVGKTRLLVEYCYRSRDSYPDGVFWVNGAGDWSEEFASIGAFLEPYLAAEPPKRRIRAAADYLRTHTECLLIIDNVDDPILLRRPVTPDLIPAGLSCHILYSTRRRNVGDAYAVDITVLPTEDALVLLLKRAHRSEVLEQSHPEHADARAICAILGNLPLALELAGSHLRNRPHASLATYLRQLIERGALGVVDDPRGGVRDLDLGTRHVAAVAATLAEQWDEVDDSDARLMLLVAAQLPESTAVPLVYLGLLAGISIQSNDLFGSPFHSAWETLLDLSLVEDVGNGQMRLHPLVREYAASQVPEVDIAAFRTACVKNLLAAYQDSETLDQHLVTRGTEAVVQDIRTALDMLPSQVDSQDLVTVRESLAKLLASPKIAVTANDQSSSE